MRKKQLIISRWLYIIAYLVFALVIVGGITRLKGAGLSIIEWRPITGALPPFSDAEWLAEFAKYKTIPQYELINKGMNLDLFKSIYLWEWFHRNLARLVGLSILIPFIFFHFRKWLSARDQFYVIGIGLLVAAQGFMGWIMVASGLGAGMTAVAPVKLMYHLTLAAIIFTILIVLAKRFAKKPRIRLYVKFIYALLLLQIALGALVAGNNAGLTFNTFPFMDGKFIPPSDILFSKPSLFDNYTTNIALVQFNHRLVGMLLVFFVFLGWLKQKVTLNLTLLVIAQAGLGILTLVYVVPFSLAIVHQGMAFFILYFALHDKYKR